MPVLARRDEYVPRRWTSFTCFGQVQLEKGVARTVYVEGKPLVSAWRLLVCEAQRSSGARLGPMQTARHRSDMWEHWRCWSWSNDQGEADPMNPSPPLAVCAFLTHSFINRSSLAPLPPPPPLPRSPSARHDHPYPSVLICSAYINLRTAMLPARAGWSPHLPGYGTEGLSLSSTRLGI